MSDSFQKNLRMSVANPEGKQAKHMLGKLLPVLTSGSKKTVFGALERRAAAGEILAMGHRYGPASNFLTVRLYSIISATINIILTRLNIPLLCLCLSVHRYQ